MSAFTRAKASLIGYRGVGGTILFFFPVLWLIGLVKDIQHGISVASVIIIVAFLVPVTRLAMMAIRVHDDGISVTNSLRTHRIPWTDIRLFTMGSVIRMPVVVVELNDGTEVKAGGTYSGGGSGGTDGARRATSISQKLNAELDRHKASNP